MSQYINYISKRQSYLINDRVSNNTNNLSNPVNFEIIAMPEKDPTSYSYITYLWVFILSAWGGIVSFNAKRKQGLVRSFNIMELLGEISTSAFAGIITFYLCEWSDLDKLLSAALVAISGHMGSKAIREFEKWAENRLTDRTE
jgi:hypothetical protein